MPVSLQFQAKPAFPSQWLNKSFIGKQIATFMTVDTKR